MSEIDYRQKYKYYKREMLESLLVSGRKLQDAEILAICPSSNGLRQMG